MWSRKLVLPLLGLCLLVSSSFRLPAPTMKLALLKYRGGGDWYSDPTALTNLSKFCNEEIGTSLDPNYATVASGSVEIFDYPYVHATGHGNILFTEQEAANIRAYLIGGGFLHIDDNYGMDPFVQPAMKQVFPELDFVLLPFSHEIFHQKFDFPEGLPKIHEHDGKPPQAFGLFWEGRLVCLYTYECDLGDGWEDPEVHRDPPELRRKALQMGANIIQYAFSH